MTTENRRYQGYVVGSDATPEGRTVWKVRVKDPASPHNGQKLVVASTHEEITLARGLNVNFLVGTVDDEHNQKVVRAVDVQLETLEQVNRSRGEEPHVV